MGWREGGAGLGEDAHAGRNTGEEAGEGLHSILDRESCPGPTAALAENDLVTLLLAANREGEEEPVQVLKGKLEELVEETNELSTKISKAKGDFLYKSAQLKDMTLHVQRLEEHGRKLAAENESLRVSKRDIIDLQKNRSLLKHLVKATKMIEGRMEDQYVGIGLQIEPMFTAWCVEEVEEMQHFSTQPSRNWIFPGHEVS